MSGGQIWEGLECLFKEFGLCFAPVGNGGKIETRRRRTICILGGWLRQDGRKGPQVREEKPRWETITLMWSTREEMGTR